MKRSILLLGPGLLVAAVLLIAACGGDDDDSGEEATGEPTQSTQTVMATNEPQETEDDGDEPADATDAPSESFDDFSAERQEVVDNLCNWSADAEAGDLTPGEISSSLAEFDGYPNVNFLSIALMMQSAQLGDALYAHGDALKTALTSRDLDQMASVGADISETCLALGWTS